MIVELTALRAWCVICDEQISPASRRTRKEAMQDEAAHMLIVHEDAEHQNRAEEKS